MRVDYSQSLLNVGLRRGKLLISLLVQVLLVSLISACSDPVAELPVTKTVVFNGICDGSAAVLVDDQSLLVAYDESNSLYLYNVDGGMPLAEFSYQALLGIDSDEVDVEAVAVADNGLWWIGSHGLDGDGDKAPNRSILFRTNAPDSADSELRVLESVTDLMSIILDTDDSNALFSKKTLKKKPKKGGFNIEGLAVATDGSLLVGLRSPLSASDLAIIVQLRHTDSGFVVQQSYQPDLGGRGIRDIQPSADDGFIIIAGDVESHGVFALYHWQPGGKASVLTHLDRGLNPEALVRFADHWLVFSDDGKMERSNGVICDDLAGDQLSTNKEVFFRAIKVSHDSLARK